MFGAKNYFRPLIREVPLNSANETFQSELQRPSYNKYLMWPKGAALEWDKLVSGLKGAFIREAP